MLDINDNPPIFPPTGFSVLISEGALANLDVIAANATDNDVGINGKLRYEIIAGNDEGWFLSMFYTFVIETL